MASRTGEAAQLDQKSELDYTPGINQVNMYGATHGI